jgi:hypothetical protein
VKNWYRPLAAVVLLAAAACRGPDEPAGGVAPAGITASPCRPYRLPHEVRDLNETVAAYRSVPEFRGGDVGADALLPDGRRLWFFGDTLRGPSFGGPSLVRNSVLVFAPGCVQTLFPADRGAIIPDRPDGVGYWPMSVLAQRVRRTASIGAFAFQTLGPAVAALRVTGGGLPRLVRVVDLGPDSADERRPAWGAAAWLDGGQVYLYGTARSAAAGVFGRSLAVARSTLAGVADLRTWRYWDGRSWQRDPARAAVLIGAAGGVSQTLSVFRQGAGWYAVSKRDEFLGRDLVVWSAPGPAGPFRTHPPVAAIPSDLDHRLFRYDPLAHPSLLPHAGTVVVSVSQNTDDPAALRRDPVLYRPRFLRVRLS